MSDGDRKTVGAGPVSRAPSCSLCPGCYRWTVPPTGFEPASSWRSNAPTRRSPRAVGKLTVRRAMTPVGVLCGRRNASPRRPHAWGKPAVTASRIRGCPLCQTRKTLSGPAPRVLPRGIEPLASSLKNWRLSPTETPGASLLLVPSAWGRTRTFHDQGNSPTPPPGGSPRHREGPTGFEPAILRLKAACLSA